MGWGKKSRHNRRKDSLDIDLLSAAFGLPTRFSLQRAAERADERADERAEKLPTRKAIEQVIMKDDDDDDDDGTESSFSSFDEGEDFSEESESGAEASPPRRRLRSPSPKPQRPRHRRFRAATPSRKPARHSPSHASTPRVPASRHSSSQRSSPRSSRVSRRSTPSRVAPPPVASSVRPSPSFPSHLPVQMCSQTSSVSPAPTPFPDSASHSATFPVQPQYYYQPQFAFGPMSVSSQTPNQMPQYAAPQMPPQVAVYPDSTPAPQQTASHYQTPASQQPSSHFQKHAWEPSPPGWAASSGPYARELQRIQKDIDLKMMDLARQPDHPFLRSDLRRLQDQLNLILNAAITKQGLSNDAKPVEPPVMTDSPTHAAEEKIPEKDDGKQPDRVCEDNQKGMAAPPPTQERPRRQHISAELQEESPRQIIHHLCSGCGCMRSPIFHVRHPFYPQRKPIVNFCEVCREKKIQRGVVGKYHFCFSYGQVRSKQFQREHPILPGDPIIPNYCGPCLKELRPDEDIMEASVVGANEGSVRRKSKDCITIAADDDNSLTAHLHQGHRKRRGANRTGRYAVSPIEEGNSEETSVERIQVPKTLQSARQAEKHRPKPLVLGKSMLQSSPVETTTPPPFCPNRSSGSAGRRAQRNSPSMVRDQVSSPDTLEPPKPYRAPYIEDSVSAPNSRRGSPLPTARDGQFPRQPLTETHVERSYPPNNLTRAKAEARGVASPRTSENSVQSDRSSESARSSSRSSSSKTVRFRNMVDIRDSASLHDLDSVEEADATLDAIPRTTRRVNSPLVSNLSKSVSSFSGARQKERSGAGRVHSHHGPSRNGQCEPGQDDRQLADNTEQGVTSPGFRNGAFSMSFEADDDEWENFKAQSETRRSPRFRSSFGPCYGYDSELPEGFPPTGCDGEYDEDNEETEQPRTSFQPSGGISSKSSPTKSRASSPHSDSYFKPPPFSACSTFTDPDYHYFGEDESVFHSEFSFPQSDNPYYDSQKGRSHRHYMPKHRAKPHWGGRKWPQPDDVIPEPIIEEASSICSSHDSERQTMMLEYNIVVTDSSETEEDSEPEIEEHTSEDETIKKNSLCTIATH
ncbi:Fc.00g066560.m01.CDS01 [Cosmosporella sp. VM-42]